MANTPKNLWNESLALQIPAIDAQHRGLFDLAYELECSIETGKDDEALAKAVEQLKEYCQNHFVAEERLMHELGYAGLHAHVLKHDDFTRAVLEFESQREESTAGIARQILAFLKQWLTTHIAVEDKKLAPLIHQPAADPVAGTLGLPILVEVESTAAQADTALCTSAANHLMKKGWSFVGLAHSLDQTRATLETIKSLGQAPAVFVINTFGAKDILGELDSLMGDLPVLYLRRALYAGRSGLMDQASLIPPATAVTATVALKKMKPRLTSMWFYGTQNSGMIAQRAAEAVNAYLKTGNFKQIERARPAS